MDRRYSSIGLISQFPGVQFMEVTPRTLFADFKLKNVRNLSYRRIIVDRRSIDARCILASYQGSRLISRHSFD